MLAWPPGNASVWPLDSCLTKGWVATHFKTLTVPAQPNSARDYGHEA